MAIRDWPIKRKLTAILLLISGLVLVLTSAAFVTYQVVTFRQTMRNNLATRSRILAANSTAALAFANEADATEILAALKYDPHMVAAALYTQDGRVLATYPVAASADLIPAALQPDGYRFERGRLVGFTPVAQGGNERLGTLYLASDTKAVSDALRLSGIIAVVVLAIAMLAAYALAAALQGRISAPILALADTAKVASTGQDYSVRAPKFGEDELGVLTDAFNEMLRRIEQQKQELQQHALGLEQRVAERTQELEHRNEQLKRNAAELLASNTELDAFAYSVSHDLRAPLRSIDGFSQVLLEGSAAKLDETDRGHLERITLGVRQMHRLINDLLNLSTIVRAPLHAGVVDLGQLAQEILQELRERAPERRVECVIAEGIKVQGDAGLLRLALENLLSNAWKFTGAREQAHITLGARRDDEGRDVYYVRDDGAGFDPQYADKLFSPFQRLHPQTQFPGTGIGLATVQRIIHRHGGEIWAESSVDRGACFYFTLAEMACGHFSERSY